MEEAVSPVDERRGTERLREDYEKALRVLHEARMERVESHPRRFSREPVLEGRGQLREVEERAYDRFLRARDLFAEAQRWGEQQAGPGPSTGARRRRTLSR